ncbi:MAG TPA: polysaccharide deacetylase family protein [Bradyrhizobium sp.]|uniref:polysaccharide deacetylase family protein n=1 Tax=Bradyrhizobium sp. TaxID=376 RepID=UPI002D7E7A7B|nr:polysaccharide deacetylase family protein [Bradyrhizobium sp.]HET7885109.1 polysaccharide deacetylase family protein [Bradyrhizobium sp.]
MTESPERPALQARVSNRLSRYFSVTPFRLRNERPMVSFTFDDFPESAATDGVSILDQYNAKATFYVSGSLVDKPDEHWQGVSADGIVELHRHGHEIACHTFSHQPATELDATRLAREIEQNRIYLHGIDPSIRMDNFAYPYGLGSVWRKAQLAKAFRSSRGIIPGINSGVVDLQYLRATPLINRNIDEEGIDRAFDAAVDANGWLIFYGHDVTARPSPFGCTPSLLRYALDAAAKRNVAVKTVAGALDTAGAAEADVALRNRGTSAETA